MQDHLENLKKIQDTKAKDILYFAGYISFFAASTTEYHYSKRGITQQEFNLQKYTILVEDKNVTSDYYYLIRELFNGLRIFTILFLIYLILFDNLGFKVFIFYSFLYFLFWLKAYNSAKNFTYEVTKVYKALKVKPPTL